MCGITGILNINNSKKIDHSDNVKIKRMTELLHKRGPDETGYFYNDDISFGHKRLKIIDLKSGQQPMTLRKDNYILIFNGEIYNYKELKKKFILKETKFKTNSDTEVILHAYENYGTNFVNLLRGMFAIAIWDNIKKILILARDRAGQKPLYYTQSNDKFYFSSELKSLYELQDLSLELKYVSVDNYFQYGYVNAPDSIFKNIHQIEPGCLLEFEQLKKTYKKTKYWTLTPNPNYSENKNYFIRGVRDLLDESVNLRMQSDVPIGVLLSGGLDSSIITSLASKYKNNLKTFSIEFKEKQFNESKYSRLVSSSFNTKHTFDNVDENNFSVDDFVLLVKSMDGPFGDSSYIPTYWVSKIAKQKVTVALSGDGADELFAGYQRYNTLLKINKYSKIIKLINTLVPFIEYNKKITPEIIFQFFRKIKKANHIIKLKNEDQIKNIISYFNYSDRRKIFSDEYNFQISTRSKSVQLKGINDSELLNEFLLEDLNNNLPGDLLVKVDRASMANSLEVRSPFLDHKLMEFAMTIPPDLKLYKGENKYILKEVYKNILPTEILKRNKKGFEIPFHRWFKHKKWKDFLIDMLSSDLLTSQNVFNAKKIVFYRDQILKNSEAKKLNISSYQLVQRIYLLLVFQVWYTYNFKSNSN